MIQFLQTIINAITVPVRQLYLWFCNCLPGIGYLGRLSLPWKWALITLTALLSLWICVGIKQQFFTENITRFDLLIWIAVGSPALLIIPFLVYHFVRYWMMKEESKFPDIDRIWYEGLEQTAQNGIELGQTPIFLILGTTSVRESNNFLQIAGFQPVAQSPSNGEGPISFFANEMAVVLFLHGCSCLSRLSKSPSRTLSSATEPGPESNSENGGTIDSTYFAKLKGTSLREPSATATSPMFSSGEFAKEANPLMEQAGGTMLFDDSQDYASVGVSASSSRQLTSQEFEDCDARMRHVCQLLQRARGSICPINGALTTIPFELVETSPGALQVSIQRDISILANELRVRVPNTVLVTGFERDEGFIELMKRLPKAQVANNRFGKGADLWSFPSADRLAAIANHATSQFEDWIYDLFRAEESLKQRHNSRLFGLLCRMRGTFAENLLSVLPAGFGIGPRADAKQAESQFLFGGCYFAATGVGKSEQGFASNVFKKLLDQLGEIEWTPSALEEDRRFQFLSNLALLAGLLSLIAIVVMIVNKFVFSS